MGQNMSGGFVMLGAIVGGGLAGAYLGYRLGAAAASALNMSNHRQALGVIGAIYGVQYGIGFSPLIMGTVIQALRL